MPEKEEKEEEKKRPIDMTTDELLDYALAPELAERLREVARGDEPESDESEKENC